MVQNKDPYYVPQDGRGNIIDIRSLIEYFNKCILRYREDLEHREYKHLKDIIQEGNE